MRRGFFRFHVPVFAVFMLAAGRLFAAIPFANVDNFWQPVTDAEMKMSAPVVDPTAGVEAIFWRVHVLDDISSNESVRISVNYVRLKVFSQEGKDKAATMEIPFGYNSTVGDVFGRTIRPDGSVLELSKDAVHETVKVKSGGIKRKVKSFAMPGVEVGSIIEYRWREYQQGGVSRYLRLQFQNDFPVQRAMFFVRPLPLAETGESMSLWPFNCKSTPLKAEVDGFDSTTVEKLPAYREEPMMPGQPNVRPWILVYYPEQTNRKDPDKYWDTVGRKAYHDLKISLKINGELKDIAAKAVQGAKDDNDKAVRLIGWIRGNMRNLYGREVSDEERAKLLKKIPKDRARTSVEVYKSGVGDSDELNMLFAAMATEAGLDARPVMMADREDMLFDKRMAEKYFLPNVDMAVQIGGKWKIYDVSTKLLAPGMLSWREEGVPALVADPKSPSFIVSPISAPADSQSTRKAKLKLGDDGSLDGDVNESWTGHAAEEHRRDIQGESDARRIEATKEAILKAFPQAEVSDLHLENAENPEQPLQLRYHVRIPQYAGRTGKRILFQPLFFQRNDAPLFTAEERHFSILFQYPWQESDEVSIMLPQGFELEKAENPGDISFGPPGSYELKMSLVNKRELVCKRNLVFGNEGMIYYPQTGYPTIKAIFDDIHRRDGTTLSLCQTAVAQVMQ